MKQGHPVFFDSHRKRWPRVKWSALFLGMFITASFLLLAISILTNPVLQTLSLPSIQGFPLSGRAALSGSGSLHPFSETKASLIQAIQRSENRNKRRQSVVVTPIGAMKRIGFLVNWDDTSFSSLKSHLFDLDIVVGEWLHLQDATGNISVDNLMRQQQIVQYIRSHNAQISLFALINNYAGDSWQSDLLTKTLATPESRKNLVNHLLTFAQSNGFQGISIDFENIPDTAQKDFTIFIQELAQQLHTQKLLLSVNVPVDNDSFHYKELSDAVDEIIIMAYDEHWATGHPGPIASMQWFKNVVGKRLQEISPAKMVVALGNYGYDWTEGTPQSEARTFEESVITAKESEGVIYMDSTSLNPTFDYYDDKNILHRVWFLDATTIFNQLSLLTPLHVYGVALWRLGSEDPSLWPLFNKMNVYDETTSSSLSKIHFAYDMEYVGQGEILQVSQDPQEGKRSIHFDAHLGLITGQSYEQYPSTYLISRYGVQKKEIALTFDDGPDPRYTGLILDILRDAHVPATFFIIGSNAENAPDLLKRMYDEGHDVGNHTFTHPNISSISFSQLRLELSATERLIETILGHQSHLFRSPYAEDSEPETSDQVRPLKEVENLGYISVGMGIDPTDWESPPADTIVNRVLEQVKNGDGNIVLLHDSGGDRAQTILALPRIIQALQNQGYKLVTVSALLGKQRDDVMPPVTGENMVLRMGDMMGFEMVNWWHSGVQFFFLIGIILGLGRLFFVIVAALYQSWQQKKKKIIMPANLSVAVIVPGYNEEKVINQTITSLLASDHPALFDIIVIDDGSTDHTYEVVHKKFGKHPQLKVYKVPNGGKSMALNIGMQKTTADIIVALDADTIFTRKTISALVRHFRDSHIAAVAGNAKVGNRLNLMTRWQALEYITSQNLDRRAFHTLNCITVVPGAVGAWRRDVVLAAGGFQSDTLAEDTDLTMKIRRMGYYIEYDDSAIALTEAPDTVRGFVKQRYRWMYGTFQATWKHLNALFRPQYGTFGFIALPNILIYQILFPLISPIMDLLMVISVVNMGVDRWQHPLEYNTQLFERVLFYYVLFIMVDFLAAFVAFLLEKDEKKSLLLWLIPQRFFYRQLIYYVAIKSLISAIRGHEVGWNKLDRKATVDMKDYRT